MTSTTKSALIHIIICSISRFLHQWGNQTGLTIDKQLIYHTALGEGLLVLGVDYRSKVTYPYHASQRTQHIYKVFDSNTTCKN